MFVRFIEIEDVVLSYSDKKVAGCDILQSVAYINQFLLIFFLRKIFLLNKTFKVISQLSDKLSLTLTQWAAVMIHLLVMSAAPHLCLNWPLLYCLRLTCHEAVTACMTAY